MARASLLGGVHVAGRVSPRHQCEKRSRDADASEGDCGSDFVDAFGVRGVVVSPPAQNASGAVSGILFDVEAVTAFDSSLCFAVIRHEEFQCIPPARELRGRYHYRDGACVMSVYLQRLDLFVSRF